MSTFWFLSRFCLRKGKEEGKFKSLEVREASSLHLKKGVNIRSYECSLEGALTLNHFQ